MKTTMLFIVLMTVFAVGCGKDSSSGSSSGDDIFSNNSSVDSKKGYVIMPFPDQGGQATLQVSFDEKHTYTAQPGSQEVGNTLNALYAGTYHVGMQVKNGSRWFYANITYTTQSYGYSNNGLNNNNVNTGIVYITGLQPLEPR